MEMPKGGVSAPADSGAYTDLNRLNALKTGDKDSDANLKKVAQEFESLFVGEMLKSMRSANDVLGKDNPMNTETTKQYQSMYDQQLAVTLSKQGNGIGLQDVLMRQLSKNKGVEHTGSNPFAHTAPALSTLNGGRNTAADIKHALNTGAASAHSNDMALMNQRRLSLPSKLADRVMAGITPATDATAQAAATQALARNGIKVTNTVSAAQTAATDTDSGDSNEAAGEWQSAQAAIASGDVRIIGRSVAQPPLAPAKKAFSTADDFVATMMPLAKDAAARIGVDPSVLVAQAALETGWGRSVMRDDSGKSSHNLFGIKASGNWQGDQARAITSEFRNGKMVKETAQFRSYDSYADSFHDLVTLLQSNDRYQGVVKSADNPEQFVRELQKAGYATDPNYASKISAIAKQMKGYANYAQAGSSTTL
ncbi:flagellar assembly peptidoglycan hydrolase FlgJ [Pseudomonas eucalypticola]|uniref:Peptidoglycan hydrolase FlgJ n=1 Tax=Pseudomonas eucalypticola TaxID=2599595 RepID=A0A7D5H238_9PSED|nr:flagellar assembly peptidoglycan hydrolase FlgJ [Pseudomonas eucalypticola]QKZ03602.1 flagellar assembly peptidoglycan hydrolase FlgJ [Pseudomonas eucalypticola]